MKTQLQKSKSILIRAGLLLNMIFPISLFAQWTQLGPGSPDIMLNSVYFFDNNTGFVVGNNGYIKKTSNGGNTWSVIRANALKLGAN